MPATPPGPTTSLSLHAPVAERGFPKAGSWSGSFERRLDESLPPRDGARMESPGGSESRSGDLDLAFDGDRIRDDVEDRAVPVHGADQAVIALLRFRASQGDKHPDGGEAWPDRVVQAEEPAQIEVTLDASLDAFEGDAELGRPHLIGDG